MLRFLANVVQGNQSLGAYPLLVSLGRHLLAAAKSVFLALRWLLATTFKFLVRSMGRLLWRIAKGLFQKLVKLLGAIAWRLAFWVFWGAMAVSLIGAMSK